MFPNREVSLQIRSDEGLTLETSAFRISVRWPIYIINSVDKTKFLYITTKDKNIILKAYCTQKVRSVRNFKSGNQVYGRREIQTDEPVCYI